MFILKFLTSPASSYHQLPSLRSPASSLSPSCWPPGGQLWLISGGEIIIGHSQNNNTISRSETVASPEPSKPPVRQQRRSSLEKIITTSFTTRLMMDPGNYSTSSVLDVDIELDSLSSPMLERPCTLPELNSRPASRVMKSFSCQGVSQSNQTPCLTSSSQEDLETQKRKTASAIVTSGALTFMVFTDHSSHN